MCHCLYYHPTTQIRLVHKRAKVFGISGQQVCGTAMNSGSKNRCILGRKDFGIINGEGRYGNYGTACGGGGGGDTGTTGQNPPPISKTTSTVTINLTGSLTGSTTISGADFTLTLPANVTPAMTNGDVATGVLFPAGTFAGRTLSPQVVYTAATANAPGTLKLIMTNSVAAGVTQVGEVATITLQLANGAAPTAGSFVVSGDSVIDAALYASITGMNVVVANVTLQ